MVVDSDTVQNHCIISRSVPLCKEGRGSGRKEFPKGKVTNFSVNQINKKDWSVN